ncbi:hypothetical protein [Legionella worsleiensis]|uniref:Ankyrin repeat protein n=1 Tax=Legionella worsleiensis TaxID=45076 RepID=A0A0W1AGG0_9GAMM|nr:hypothetical protein [Legionella worsleiensis]KTD80350.1 ankyrin repeat protein [Legionella worsleiensis]STY32755.1 ankyrin repeat protein [Legionella worsleiensis]
MEVILDSEQKLREHHYARSIPWYVWRDAQGFNLRANETELKRITEDTENASRPLNPDENPIKAMFCFICGHPGSSREELLKAGRRMNCPDSAIAKASILSGRADLLAQLPGTVVKNFLYWGSWAYKYSAANGHLRMLMYLESHMDAGSKKTLELMADAYYVYRNAAANGHLEILVHFESRMDARQQRNALEAANYYAYQNAAANGHLATLVHLESHMNDKQLHGALSANNYYAYRQAFSNQHTDIQNHLLRHASVFAYAEQHVHEFSNSVRHFAKGLIHKWQTDYERFQANHSNGVFDLDENEVKLGFYLARHLIRENTPEACEQLGFLLGIPGIADLAHREITPNQPNELLLLALRLSNRLAVKILFTLPPVRELAEQHNYYARKIRGTKLDLHALVQDRKSSILRPLNEDILKEEIRKFARTHFINSLINSHNLPLLLQVKAILTEGGELNDEHKHAMKSLDIPAAQYEAFILSLQAKYAEEWSENYTQFLHNYFRLPDGDATHVKKFWLLTNFNALLEQQPQPSALSFSAVWGFFTRAVAQTSEHIDELTCYFNG